MSLNTSKCNHLTPMRFKGLIFCAFVQHRGIPFGQKHKSELWTMNACAGMPSTITISPIIKIQYEQTTGE